MRQLAVASPTLKVVLKAVSAFIFMNFNLVAMKTDPLGILSRPTDQVEACGNEFVCVCVSQ